MKSDLPYIATFQDGHLKDVFIRTSDLPPILTVLPDSVGFTPIGLTEKATYFLRECDTDGVGLYSTSITNNTNRKGK